MLAPQKQELLHISFNQDGSFFSIGTQKGFKVFSINPEPQESISRQFGAGIGIVEMLHKTNIFALVGGGKTPRYPKNKLMIWDDSQMKCIVETSCKSEVKSVRIKVDRCIVVLQTKIFVFHLADFRMLESIETCPNPKGLCSIGNMKEGLVLSFPSKKIGFVQILNETANERCKKIETHKSTLCALELCPYAYKLATASQKGTIIRIFDVATSQCIQELRRGSEYATIYSLAFDLRSDWLACSSDSGTIHIFSLKPSSQESDKDPQPKNKKSKLSIFSKLSSYFDSQWSLCTYRTPHKQTKVGFISGSNKQNLLAVVSITGMMDIVKFDGEKGGQAQKIAEYNLMQSDKK